MAFEQQEISTDAGEPIYLYSFTDGRRSWRYTSADQDIIISSDTYSSVPISHSNLVRSSTVEGEQLTITTSREIDFLNNYSSLPVGTKIRYSISEFHLSDLTRQVINFDSGTVRDVNRTETSEVNIICDNYIALLDRNLLRRFYSRTCTHALYGAGCNVDRNAFTVFDRVQVILGNVVTINALGANFEDNYFTGGYIESLTSEYRRAFISSHIGDDLTVFPDPQGFGIGSNISISAGCDRTTLTCQNKFNNLLNYGGFPVIPEANPATEEGHL